MVSMPQLASLDFGVSYTAVDACRVLLPELPPANAPGIHRVLYQRARALGPKTKTKTVFLDECAADFPDVVLAMERVGWNFSTLDLSLCDSTGLFNRPECVLKLIMQHSPPLTSLKITSLDSRIIGSEAVLRGVAGMCRTFSALTLLQLRNQQFSPNGCQNLAEALFSLNNLRHLDLSNNELTPSDLNALLRGRSSLTALHLDRVLETYGQGLAGGKDWLEINEDAPELVQLSWTLAQQTNLQVLSLMDGTVVSPAATNAIASALCALPSIRRLHLCPMAFSNSICQKLLSKAIAAMPSLESLDVPDRSVPMWDVFHEALDTAGGLSCLHTLRMTGVLWRGAAEGPIKDVESSRCLARTITSMPALCSLELVRWNLTDAALLWEHLVVHSADTGNLREVSLNSCKIDNVKAASALAGAVGRMSSLRTFSANFHDLSCRDMNQFKGLLPASVNADLGNGNYYPVGA